MRRLLVFFILTSVYFSVSMGQDKLIGDEKIMACSSGETIVTDICSNGIWTETNVDCPEEVDEDKICCKIGENGYKKMIEEPCLSMDTNEIADKDYCEEEEGETCTDYCRSIEEVASFECLGYIEVSGTHPDCGCDWVCEEVEEEPEEECVVQGDCGGENDVCSNGNCVSIPEVVEEEELEEEIEEEEEQEEVEEIEEEEEIEDLEIEGGKVSDESGTEEETEEEIEVVEQPLADVPDIGDESVPMTVPSISEQQATEDIPTMGEITESPTDKPVQQDLPATDEVEVIIEEPISQ